MIIGIHPDRIGKESYSDKWKEYLEGQGVDARIINLLAGDALDQACSCDGIMWRWVHHPHDKQSARQILYILEYYLSIPTYPNFRTAWHFDEKIAQYYLLKSLKAPMPDTWLFWEYNSAIEWTNSAKFPVVFKLSSGAGSSNVLRVNSEKDARTLIDQIFRRGIFPSTFNNNKPKFLLRSWSKYLQMVLLHWYDAGRYAISGDYPRLSTPYWKPEYGYAYFQEFLPNNLFDTRITIIGERAFGFRRMNRPGDFRASGSGRINYDPDLIDPRCIEIAFQVSQRGGFQSMAYDFLFDNDHQPVISEISYGFADQAVHNCPGHWLPDHTWMPGNLWPEYAQAEDFLAKLRINTQ